MTTNEIFQLFQAQIVQGHRSLYFLQLDEHIIPDGGGFHITMQVLVTNVKRLDELVATHDLVDADGREGYHLPYPRFKLKSTKESV